MQTDTELEKNGSGPLWALAIPLLYLFLLGPAARYYDAFPLPVQQVLETIYFPLQWLDERLPGNPFSFYVDLWVW